MLQKAALHLDSPGVVDSRRDRREHAERAPDERHPAADSQGYFRRLKGVELTGDEIELSGEIAKDEADDLFPFLGARRERAEDRQHQQEQRKQREQRVVRNRRGVCEDIAVVEIDDRSPGGTAQQPQMQGKALACVPHARKLDLSDRGKVCQVFYALPEAGQEDTVTSEAESGRTCWTIRGEASLVMCGVAR